MDKLLVCIDFARWDQSEGMKYEIEGWCVSTINQPVTIRVLGDDGQEIEAEITKKYRPDVKEALKPLEITDEPGFTIIPKDILGLKDKTRYLNVYLAHDGEEKLVFQEETENIWRDYYKDSIHCNTDLTVIKNGKVTLHGWIYNELDGEKIFVLDEKGKEIPHQIKRVPRMDVAEQFKLSDQKAKYGFEIYLKRSDIRTRMIRILVKSPYVENSMEVDMRKADFDNTRVGKVVNAFAPEKFEENWTTYKDQGLRQLRYKVITESNFGVAPYDIFCGDHKLSEKEIARQRKKKFAVNPKFSIVIPLFNTPLEYLEIIIDSILNQSYGNLQLCLADGSTKDEVEEFVKKNYVGETRISYKRLEKNGGISENTNAALEMADGDFIMLSDHDDVVTPDALYEMVKAINENPDIDVIYTDEDKIDMKGKMLYDPFFKPDFNLDLLRSNNYICHIFVVKKGIVDKIGKFRSAYDGAQDYDFILRCCEQANVIHHIPKVLYHWRSHPASTAGNPESKMYAYEAGRNAVAAHYERLGIDAKVTMTEYFGRYRTQYAIKGEPLVSVIIPNKDHKKDLKRCIDSIYDKTTYQNYEVIIVENNSVEAETFSYYEELKTEHENLKVLEWKDRFNYSAINNFGASHAKGEYLLLLNNDVEVITEDWMEEMLGYCQREDVGAVGCRLYYPNDKIQHAGIILGMGNAKTAGHIFYWHPRKQFSYAGKVESTQDLSAVTAACMMTKHSLFDELGGLDETLRIALNDVDYCLKLRAAGKKVVYDAFVEMYHYESVSRGSDVEEKANKKRYAQESKIFRNRWKKVLDAGDPYYNPNLTLRRPDCTFR